MSRSHKKKPTLLETADLSPKVERAFLVGVETQESAVGESQALLDELAELVSNLAIGVVGSRLVKLRQPQPKFLLGSGKVQQVLAEARDLEADCLVFDHELTPGQQRNWEAESKLCVIDRQEVILDIFGERAQTREAVLQVELARLDYALPRLRRAWTHLSRQRGGGVTQRGEGEKQLQLDQRMIRERIARLKKELAEVVQHREVQRKRRASVPVPSAALVGYTNAGKSSLLNALTGARVQAEDKLFATLDPTTRRSILPSGLTLLLTDTVGFVRNLPHRLVDAFKATLEEAVVSDFLILVIDASSADAEAHFRTTREVLTELGADRKRCLVVFNKMDAVAQSPVFPIEGIERERIFEISALTGEGLEEFRHGLDSILSTVVTPMELLIPHQRYDWINRLHQAGAVRKEDPRPEGVYIQGNVPRRFVEPLRPFALNGSAEATLPREHVPDTR